MKIVCVVKSVYRRAHFPKFHQRGQPVPLNIGSVLIKMNLLFLTSAYDKFKLQTAICNISQNQSEI